MSDLRVRDDDLPHDPTTGLPLRPALDAAIERAQETSKGMTTACFFIRIDGQEHLAQRWGADGRDEILRRTAERLRISVRSDDYQVDWFARFLRLLPDES